MQYETETSIVVDATLLGIEDAAKRLSISPWTVRLYVRTGKLGSVKLGRRVLIESSEIVRLIEAGRRPAVQA